MLALFKPTKHSVLGIDISSSCIKLVEISGKGEKRTIEKYGSISIPSAAVDGHLIKDPDAVANALKLLITKNQITTKKAVISVPDSAIISKILQINEGFNESEIEEIILLEADKYIPYPIEEINIDFEVLGTSVKNPAKLDVLIVASRSENVNSRVEVIMKAGLLASVVDVESFAIERTVKLLSQELPANAQDKIIALVDIGKVFSNLFVLCDLKTIFTREEEFGSRQLIHSLMQQYSLSYQQAVQIQVNHSFPEDYTKKVLSPYIETVIAHIKRGLQFFFSTSHYSHVDYILLAGGAAIIPNMAELVQEQIDIPTAIANPINYLDLGDKISDEIHKEAPTLLTACGLALRQAN